MKVHRIRAQGSPVAAGLYEGMNKPVKGPNQDGEMRVFKHNGAGFGDLPAFADIDDKEIVLSAIAREVFGVPGLVLEEAVLENPDGTVTKGISTPFVPGLRTLLEAPLEAITNPDAAVAGSVVVSWFGDLDFHNSANVWLMPDGVAMPASDLGMALTEGTTEEGLPKCNRALVARFASPHNVEPTLRKIRSLSDDELTSIVDEIGYRCVESWSQVQRDAIIAPLKANRDELRTHNPFEQYYARS